jgi:hypothetical protein
MGYRFYYIKTPHPVDWIERLLYDVGYATNQNQLRVICTRDGRETHGTVAFLDEQVYFKLLQEHRVDFRIAPFEVPKVFHPNPEKYTYTYHIPFPELSPEDVARRMIISGAHTFTNACCTTDRDRFFLQQIQMKLAPFLAHGLVPHDCYTITVPVVSRARNETKAMAFVAFHDSVSRDTIATIRYVLDEGSWPYLPPQYTFKCLWARVRPPRPASS